MVVYGNYHIIPRALRKYYVGRDVQGTIVCKLVNFEDGCDMRVFAEKVRDAEELFKNLPAFPDLVVTVCPRSLDTRHGLGF